MYELLIVCPNERDFIIECNNYARFKRDSGITCNVHPFDAKIVGPQISNLPFLRQRGIDPNLLTDPAACLKVDLFRYYISTNTRYVLLAGDVDKLPTPWFEFIQSNQRYFYPTDLYYADLFKTRGPRPTFQTWDLDKDSIKGEFNSTMISLTDYYPDLSIGRIPASNVNELKTCFTRLMNRRAQTPRCLLLRGNNYDLQWLDQGLNEVADLLRNRGYSVTAMSIDPSATSSIAQNTLNQLYSNLNNGFEYIFWFGHGSPVSWAYFGPYDLNFSKIVPMTNGSPIVFSMSCNVGQFNKGVYDGTQYFSNGVLTNPIFSGSSQIPSVPDSLQPSPSTMDGDFGPEEWIVKHPQGASSLIAGHSWGTLGSENLRSQPIEFSRSLPFPDPGMEMQIKYIGDAFNRMLCVYLEQFKQSLPTDIVALNHLLRINLFGDPTTPLFS